MNKTEKLEWIGAITIFALLVYSTMTIFSWTILSILSIEKTNNIWVIGGALSILFYSLLIREK